MTANDNHKHPPASFQVRLYHKYNAAHLKLTNQLIAYLLEI